VDPNRLYTEDLEKNLYSTRMWTRNAIKNLIQAANSLKDNPLMWNNIPDVLIKSLPLGDELRNKFRVNRILWRRENSGVEEYSVLYNMYTEYHTPEGESIKQNNYYITKEIRDFLITSNTLISEGQYESVLLNMETFQGNRIMPEFQYLNQIILKPNISRSDIINRIEDNISCITGHEIFITAVLHIVSEWFWWKNITGAPEWPGVALLNNLDIRHCIDKGSDNAIIINLEKESSLSERRKDLIIYMITENCIPLYARYPLRLINNGDYINNDDHINNGDYINNVDDVPDVLLTTRFREMVSIEWLIRPDLPGRSLFGVCFWPVELHRIRIGS